MAGLALTTPGCADFRECAPVDEQRLTKVPERLSETGLYADVKAGTLAIGVSAFKPQFQLWSDGAEKRRWIWMPPGTVIDARDMDFWQFPEGTRLWKEFTRDGVRVETRLLQKTGPAPADWVAVAYRWNDDLSEAFRLPEGEDDSRGTEHDIPTASDCMGCHGGTSSGVLGFSAIQLAQPAAEGHLDLQGLVDRGLLSDAPPRDLAIPGDETERAALGYLHANCGHCHNQARPDAAGKPRCYDPGNSLDFYLRVGQLGSVADTPTYRTMGAYVQPGRPENSYLIELVSSRTFPFGLALSMPPLGSEVVDDGAVDVLTRWVEEM